MTSERNELLRKLTIALALLGILVAAYLTVSHFLPSNVLCAEGGGCDTVRNSRYSEVAGIPVAVFGLAGYLAILGTLVLEKKGTLAESGPILIFGFSLIGTLYSIYLTYLELFVIGAICPYCVASAVIMVAVFVVAVMRLRHVMRAL